MYKHFAIVTLCVTGVVAMLADGENQEAINAHAEATAQHVAKAKKNTVPKLVIKTEGRSDRGSGGGYESGGSGYSAGADSSIIPDALASVNSGNEIGFLDEVGLTPQSFAQLTEQQKEMIRLQAQNQMSPEERARQMQAAMAASAARSGHNGEH